MEASLEAQYDKASTVEFGAIHVALGRRRVADAPCEEILYVSARTGITPEDVRKYIRFHRGFVLHRAKQQWPHRYALVYDCRNVETPSSVLSAAELSVEFSTMHSELGKYYQTWLFGVVMVTSDPMAHTIVQKIIKMTVESSTKPVVAHMEAPGGPSLLQRLSGAS